MPIARRRVPSGSVMSAIPRINSPPANGHAVLLIGADSVNVRPAYLNSSFNLTGCIATTALSWKVAEPPGATTIGAVKVKVVVAVGGVTVALCLLLLRVIELNRPGRLTLIVADAMFSATSRLLRTVNEPAATVAPGAATLDAALAVTTAAVAGVGTGVAGAVPPSAGVGVGFLVAVGVAVRVTVGVAVGLAVGGFAVDVAVGFAVAVAVGFAVTVAVGFGVAVVVGFGVAVAVGFGVAVAVAVGPSFKAPKVTVKASG